jgi:hypothetical protein
MPKPKLRNDTFLAGSLGLRYIYINCYVITDLDSSSDIYVLWKYENALSQYVMEFLLMFETDNSEE